MTNLSKLVLLESRINDINRRKAEIALIDQLPDGLNIKGFKLVGEGAELCIDGNVNDAIGILSPAAIDVQADAANGTHERPLERPASTNDEYFPVWRLSASRTRWFSLLSSGKCLLVTCTGDGMALNVPHGYEAMAGTHKVFFRRRM